MADNTAERVTEDLADKLDDVLPETAHVIAELATCSIFFDDTSGKRWRLRLEES